MQAAAQNTLQNGWSFLLPTAEERAQSLSALLLPEAVGMVKVIVRSPSARWESLTPSLLQKLAKD